MSAFIMSPKGFRRLADELRSRADSSSNWWIHEFVEGAGLDTRVRQLYEANVSAVNQRYGEDTRTEELDLTPRRGFVRWSDTQLLKNLQCLRYQMSEGDVPESEVYQKLPTMIGDLAGAIVARTPAYEAAPLGW